MRTGGILGGIVVAALLLTGGPAAAECDTVPTCGVPQCAQAQDCNSRTWPLSCEAPPDGDGWWECCQGLQRGEYCCVPHCPVVAETETGTGGDEDHASTGSSSDSGGCGVAGGGDLGAVAGVLLGLLWLSGRRRRS